MHKSFMFVSGIWKQIKIIADFEAGRQVLSIEW